MKLLKEVLFGGFFRGINRVPCGQSVKMKITYILRNRRNPQSLLIEYNINW